jgi:enoyl-CoA hydratase/carnithine racemase
LTGNEISAQRLEHDGVINRLLPAKDFEKGLQSFVADITAKSKPVLELAKRAQFESYYTTFPEAMSRVQSLYLRELISLEDARRGPQAYQAGEDYEWLNR